MTTIRRVLIPNRGEIAVRIVRSLRTLGIDSVVAHSSPDSDSLAARSADRRVLLGPASPGESYLSIPAILRAAKETGADAVHPGYGFLSERAALARAVTEAGLVYVGPTAENVAALGNKQAAREALTEAGIPPVPGRALDPKQDARAIAAAVGYPLLLKATAGGGGRGIRIVRSPDELDAALEAARAEAETAFGSTAMIVERYLEGARHVEIQVLGDGRGGVRVFCERDCSTQRRLQKVVEETPSPGVTTRLREQLFRTAVAAVAKARYRGAGTLEFILSREGELFFLEVNTRIQVEHPITEAVSDVDLVAEQIAIAEGAALPPAGQAPDSNVVSWRGAAMELRVNAEDPLRSFQPEVGRLRRVRLPAGPGVRVDSGVESGTEVTPHYDSLLAKIIGYGADREQARSRLECALAESRFDGIATTIPLGLAVLGDAAFRSGGFHCQSLEERVQDGSLFPPRLEEDELVLAVAAAAWFRDRSLSAGRPTPVRGTAPSTWQSHSCWGDAP